MKSVLFACATLVATVAAAGDGSVGWPRGTPRSFRVKADRIAVDNVTKAAVLTGHVEAVSEPVRLTSCSATRDADGVMRLNDPTRITTCTNHPGVCHWALSGEVEYKDGKYVKGRNVWLEFYEMPVFWLPYFYYPLEGDCALRMMPGYVDRWGAYLLTKVVYDIAGDPSHREDTWWMHGNTRFDLRYENGVALGETLYWNMGDFGAGKFKVYYAWDENAGEYDATDRHNWYNWGSPVERDRYAIELTHRWEVSERDSVRLKGSVYSDSHIRDDFFREGTFSIKNEWLGYEGNEVAWEHQEDVLALGVSVSGPLNKFYGGVSRLPEIYLDVQPQPVLSTPLNFESENRIGYLKRSPAEYGNGLRTNPYSFSPGRWAEYGAFRFDTYDRVTLPFTVCDVLSVVPRVAYHGTVWNETGRTELTGWEEAQDASAAMRSILEGGVTFAGRGRAWLDDVWQHTAEPYVDVLAQKAWYGGLSGDARPYVFDSLDSSRMWEDQFAGRSRALPYTYYGVTPGLRNSLDKADDKGILHTVLDFDAYAALQFNRAEFWGENDYHKLANADSPNYGKRHVYVSPGARVRWTPAKDVMLAARAEYDVDNNKLAYGDVGWTHAVDDDFSYFVNYSIRDFRQWDFSSTPYDHDVMQNDDFNWAHFHTVKVGFTQQPIDWFAWSPFVRWDIKDGELDCVGAWFDYLTDCLGFRLLVAYDNEYTRIDGFRRKADWDIGFFVYLRALGPEGSNFFD